MKRQADSPVMGNSRRAVFGFADIPILALIALSVGLAQAGWIEERFDEV
jgi:hypothetical protein